MKTFRIGNRSLLVMEKGETVKKLFPMFEIASNPTISFKKWREEEAKNQGLLVVQKEKKV